MGMGISLDSMDREKHDTFRCYKGAWDGAVAGMRNCKKAGLPFGFLAKTDMLGIDDLGTEPMEVLAYGNVYTPVIDLLTKRYDEQLFTFITTNLTPQKIREHYKDRIADRLNEMVEKIIYSNDSYRTI